MLLSESLASSFEILNIRHLVAFGFSIPGGLLGWWWTAPASRSRHLIVGAAELVCPLTRYARRQQRIPWTAITFAYSSASKLGSTLWIGAMGRNYIRFRMLDFVDSKATEQIPELVRDRLTLLPDGHERVRRLDTNTAVLLRQRHGYPWVVLSFLVALLLGYAYQRYSGASGGSQLGTVMIGANADFLIEMGEWHRLLTAAVLHAFPLHLIANCFAALAIGVMLENVVGHARCAIVLIVSIVGGSVLSAAVGQNPAVGASGGIMGLIASLLYLRFKLHESLAPNRALLWATVGLVVILEIIVNLLVDWIDWACHLGGAVTGATLALILFRSKDIGGVALRVRPLQQAAAWALAALFAASIGRALLLDLEANPDRRARIERGILERPHELHFWSNEIAWRYYLDKEISLSRFMLALEAIEVAVDHGDRFAPYLDTQASLLSRTNELDRAIELEREALANSHGSDAAHYASQLARFEYADTRRRTISLEQEPAFTLKATPTDTGSGTVVIASARYVAGEVSRLQRKPGIELHAIVLSSREGSEESLLGFIRTTLPTDTLEALYEHDIELPLSDARLLVTLADQIEEPAHHEPAFKYWPLDPAVLSYPPVGDLAPSSQRARDRQGAGR